jgi:hypothetical protein
MPKINSILILAIFASPFHLAGQQVSQELFFGYGLNQLIGDVGVNKLQLLDGSIHMNYRIQRHPHYAFNFSYCQGELNGADSLSSLQEKKKKNLTIKSTFQSISTRLEIDYFPQSIPSYEFQHTPYIFGGIGLMSFNPMGEFQDEWVELQPLGTEGQGTILNEESLYSTRAWTLPFGLGYRAQLNNIWVVSLEANWTLTSTDYLDDTHNLYVDPVILEEQRGPISSHFSNPSSNLFAPGTPRGNPQNNDSFFTLNFNIGIHIEAFMERCAKFLHR